MKTSGKGTDEPTYSVDFIVATIPDYVDSNSGWPVDQGLAAIQSGMVQEKYLFDRVRLIDWSRASAGPVAVLSASGFTSASPAPAHVSALETEMAVRQHAAIIQSEAWFRLWRLADSIVTMLQQTAWRRCITTAAATAVRREVVVVEAARISGAPLTATVVAEPLPTGQADTPHQERSGAVPPTEWLARCEQLVAFQMAFVVRDIVARTITCLFAAVLCLTSLTAAHLLYVFTRRASLLTVDMLAVAATALSAVWILVDIERDHVLSRLRSTTPGRVDINWEFIKRLAVYGVLPLLAVIASLFPEVGGTLFGWLEPLRKLSSF